MSREPSSFLDDLAKGRDIIYFSEQILGVALNRAQKRWFRAVTNPDGTWACRGSVHVSGNQIGKSLGCAILILWASVYKVGVRALDDEKWLQAPYQWFHVAPSQNQAYIPLRDLSLLVKGAHPAQEIGAKRYGLKCRFPTQLVVFEQVEHGYEGFSTLLGATVQFRTTDEKAKALQGRRAHGISFDEAAFEIHLKAVINETLLMRLISTGGPLLIVSTPNGINDYYEIVESIKDRAEQIDDKTWVADDGWNLVWSTIDDNAGYGITAEEIEHKEAELDPATKEQQLRGAFLEPLEAFFTPTAQVLKAFDPDLPEKEGPQPNHRYVIFWDPSVASDPTACVVLDVTRKPWRGVKLIWMQKPAGISALISSIFGEHAVYRNAPGSQVITGFDETSMGGAIIGQQLSGLHPKRGLNFGGNSNKKLDILSNLRAALMNGDLILPDSWMRAKREILNYRLDDKKIVQDVCMALAGAAWIASRTPSTQRAKFDPGAKVARPMWR